MRRSLRQVQRQSHEASVTSSNGLSKTSEDNRSTLTHNSNSTRKRTVPPRQTRDDASHSEDDDYQSPEQATELPQKKKKRKLASRSKSSKNSEHQQALAQLLSVDRVVADIPPCVLLPARVHNVDYHRPLLLGSRKGRKDLLDWFDGISTKRSMPWRKPWIDPSTYTDDPSLLRQKLEKRAYEVWISEIMLQQTRVAVVIDYWNRWMAKWPTIHELAAATSDEVLAAWRGLGYYSRATRIHEAAKLVCKDPETKGLLPSSVDTLVANVPGVGRYTAGAISAIVFGKAAPMVDGNVLRVLSRQLGLLGDVKTDKSVIDLLWAAADSLVKAIAQDFPDEESRSAEEEEISDRPGRWGQALMELGSTICTPKPDCEVCPISETCRAYGEGLQYASTKGLAPKDIRTHSKRGSLPDIEDSCNFCKPFEEVIQDNGDDEAEIVPIAKKGKPRLLRQPTLSNFFTRPKESVEASKSVPTELTRAGLNTIVEHARKFPVKVIKKAVKEQETLVCAIHRGDGRYIIHRRPDKGLLAGLWEFPSWIVPEDYENTATAYKRAAELHASKVLDPALKRNSSTHLKLKFVSELGSVPWLFSHLKLTMHVFLFELKCSKSEFNTLPDTNDRWSDEVENESMGTGMRKCWELVREANSE
ncbi:DNA glycosylase, partial [Xylaria bambusicola]|uniref:DNA glycosylase n=1 Tax=Xylaria bambusicola TaxID=326684 RepID=UPI002008D83C